MFACTFHTNFDLYSLQFLQEYVQSQKKEYIKNILETKLTRIEIRSLL
jgi:hypothetical protein